MGGFTVWDYVVFAAMLLISAIIGIYYAFVGGGQKTSKDFLMAGRSMSAVPVALSLTASFMSAVTVLGTPAEIYRYGAVFCIFAITYFLVVLCSAEIFLPVFYKLGITSTYEVRWSGRNLSPALGSWRASHACFLHVCPPFSLPTNSLHSWLSCSTSLLRAGCYPLCPQVCPHFLCRQVMLNPAALAEALCVIPDSFPHARYSVQ